ncbi:hypothetical protein BH24ACT16_BH24ACT16_13050 [soil metagenome]|jgi:hypothetical protein
MTQGEATRLESFEALLDEFGQLPGRDVSPPTFMEIAGYPNRENACSNTLAFFIDPERPHGLGKLVLDALAYAGDIVSVDESIGRFLSVKREVTTDGGKRVDLLIETDTHVILVENKLEARTDNPFSEYASYLDQIAEGRTKYKILLSLSPNYAGREWGFKNLTYQTFVKQIRSLLGRHVSGADTRYLTLLLDFLSTLEKLKKGTRMNREFIELLENREEDVEQFLSDIEELKREMREKTRELGRLIDVDKHSNVTQLRPWLEPAGPYDDLPHDIEVSKNLVVQIETSIFAQGWEIWIWPSKGEYSELKDLLRKLEIRFEENKKDEGVWPNGNFTHRYHEDLAGISSLLQNLIDKIATSRGRRR